MCRYPSPDKTLTSPVRNSGVLLADIRIVAMDGFCFPFVKFINFFAGVLVATTAANVLLASDAYAGLPNGWTQVGKKCNGFGYAKANTYYKLTKTNSSGTQVYGVWNDSQSKWAGSSKGSTVEYANNKMNTNCDVSTYQPT